LNFAIFTWRQMHSLRPNRAISKFPCLIQSGPDSFWKNLSLSSGATCNTIFFWDAFTKRTSNCLPRKNSTRLQVVSCGCPEHRLQVVSCGCPEHKPLLKYLDLSRQRNEIHSRLPDQSQSSENRFGIKQSVPVRQRVLVGHRRRNNRIDPLINPWKCSGCRCRVCSGDRRTCRERWTFATTSLIVTFQYSPTCCTFHRIC